MPGRKTLGISLRKNRSKSHAREEIAWLEKALAKRRGKPGLASNVAELEARLAAVKAEVGE